MDTFTASLARNGGLTPEALEDQFTPAFLPSAGIDVPSASHYEQFVRAFALTDAERAKLDEFGFVVVPPRPGGRAGPVDVFYRVFAADLPVFVSADSVLHAWHRSYDRILAETETDVLRTVLAELLQSLQSRLSPEHPGTSDAWVYLEVARVLLEGGKSDSDRVQTTLDAVKNAREVYLDVMGQPQKIDFSAFIPRGHYNKSIELQRYFRAMRWLQTIELHLFDQELAASLNPREEAAARALARALSHDEPKRAYQTIDRFYRVHVGHPNALTLLDLVEFCEDAPATRCGDAALDAEQAALLTKSRPEPAYTPDPRPAEATLRFLPLRFALDAWITSQTTAPRLPPVLIGQELQGRAMASPFDVAFALGADRALTHLDSDMRKPFAAALPQYLLSAREAVQSARPLEVDATIYNHWLEALMSLATTSVDPRLPRVLRTPAWADHRLETLLASWAELRHDTILSVDMSVGRAGCQYPEGYVEPLPDLYSRLATAAEVLVETYEDDPLLRRPKTEAVLAWGEHFQGVMHRLAQLAEDELEGKPMSAADLAFLNRTVDQHARGYGGQRSYDGWYAALYFDPDWSLNRQGDPFQPYPHTAGGDSEPIVADVHLDTDHYRVLEVGTGHPELLIVAIDQGGDVSLFGGPVSSFYTFERHSSQRMTDEQWTDMLNGQRPPERPDFARGYRTQ
ncbi:MAG: DUF3160 domain-containing protein [Polyangiaceae bacterium]